MNELKKIGENIKNTISQIEGAKYLYIDQITGQTQLRININRAKLAQYNLSMKEVQSIINSSIGGTRVGKIFDTDNFSDISVRLDEKSRNNLDAINNLIIKKSNSATIRIKDIANIEKVNGLMQVNREKGEL